MARRETLVKKLEAAQSRYSIARGVDADKGRRIESGRTAKACRAVEAARTALFDFDRQEG